MTEFKVDDLMCVRESGENVYRVLNVYKNGSMDVINLCTGWTGDCTMNYKQKPDPFFIFHRFLLNGRAKG